MKVPLLPLTVFLASAVSVVADPATFAGACAERAAAATAAEQRAVAGEVTPWLFPTAEVSHLATGPFWEKQAAAPEGTPLPAIVAYDKALKQLGVTLILVPVPAKASVHPDKLVKSAAATDPAALAPFLGRLAEAGVAVIDLEPVFRQASAAQKVYCETDSHWAPWACRLAALEIARHPAVKALFPASPAAAPAGEEMQIHGDLAEGRPDAAPETINVFRAAASPVAPDDKSPILLVGDSHTAVFSEEGGSIRHHTTGAGVRDHLQALVGRPLAVVTSAGSGADGARANVARRAAAEPTYWTGKKLLVWLFSAREFTQGKWRQIPPQPKK